MLADAGVVLAYGDAPALADLERRAPGKVVGYGPKTSLAVLGKETDPEEAALAAARQRAYRWYRLGEEAFQNKIERGPLPDQDRATITLRRGRNDLSRLYDDEWLRDHGLLD